MDFIFTIIGLLAVLLVAVLILFVLMGNASFEFTNTKTGKVTRFGEKQD